MLAIVERLRKVRCWMMKAFIRDARRAGLESVAASNRHRAAFQTTSVDLGRCLLVSVDDITEALATAESESLR